MVTEPAKDARSEAVRHAPPVGALGLCQELNRQARAGHLELEADGATIKETETHRDSARECPVVLEQERRTQDIGGSGRAQGEVGDVDRGVVGEIERDGHGLASGECLEHRGVIGGRPYPGSNACREPPWE